MQTTTQGTELSVAILMDDLASAKEIAGALRLQNILAHHFLSLDEFWVASNVQVPDLVIVDVIKMSQGSVQFRNHPRVIDRSLCYAFYSKDTTKILLQSTIGLSPLGYVHADSTLSAQVLGLVNRRQKELKLEKEVKELESRVQRLQARSQRIISERSEAEEFKSNFQFIRELTKDIESAGSRHDFATALVTKLDGWAAIDAFGLFELNQSGQKLISPELSRKKYHPFPSLWLGQPNLAGIEDFAQDMAQQVALDLFDSEPIMLKIHAGNQNPDLLLFISYNVEALKSFPWDALETMLSSTLRQLKLSQQVPKYVSQFVPTWEALDNLDRIQKSGVEGSEQKIVCLSLIPLMDIVKKRSANKFFWSAFFNDFFLQLSGRLQKSTKLSLMGPWQVLFFVGRESMEQEFHSLQAFVRQFTYWKFFEDTSQVLPEEMMPTLKLLPPSASQYLRHFEKEFEELGTANESKRLLAEARRDLPKRVNHAP